MGFTDDGTFFDDDVRLVTLIDRVGTGGPIRLKSGAVVVGEFMYNSQRIPIKPTFVVRAPVAKFIMRHGSQTYVHDVDGEYVNRLGIESADPELLEEMGLPVDCTPIEVDQDRVEGWDTNSVDPDRAQTIAKRIKRLKSPRPSLEVTA